jgi:predicted phage terminase large subunit-like protein
VIAYLDTAFTQKDENAWCAFTRWGVFELNGVPKVMLASAWRDRPTLRGLVDRVVDSCRKGRVDVLVIENRAGAEWVRQEIMQLMRAGEWSIVLDEPRGDKVARLHSVTPLFEDGVIYAPERQWADMTIDEVQSFPKDLVDCTSGALGYLRRNRLIQLQAEKEADDREWRAFRGRQESIAELYGV